MAIKIEMLKCFSTVAELGSLADAANALGRTPSAVSMMLRQFEDHIGSPLFETSRKSHLTPLGELIFKEARRELRHFENTVSVIEGLSRSELGYLRLAVTPSVATTILPRVVGEFARTHPQIQIDIRDMESAAISIELSRERADIGIGTLGVLDGFDRSLLFSDEFGVICGKQHGFAQQDRAIAWQDFDDQLFIAHGLCHLIKDPAFDPILKHSRLMVPNTSSLVGLVRAGIGVTILPRMAAMPDADLLFLPLATVLPKREVHIVSQPPNLLTPAAQAFRDLILAAHLADIIL